MLSIEVYAQGSKIIVRVTWEIESVPGSLEYDTPTDPTTVVYTARQRTPAGALQAATTHTYGVGGSGVTKVSTGVFEFTHEPTPGRWYVHAQGTGTAHGGADVVYEIDESGALAA